MFIQVALVLGITGACRRDELYKLTIDDVKIVDSVCVVTIPDTKTHVQRTFTVEGKYFEMIKAYMDLRPTTATAKNLFLCYRNGRCINQLIGKNKIGSMPQEIASFLELPDPKLYTGHSFRRTSATLLADAGAHITTLKRLGGWRSTNVAESYIEDSISNKRKISNQITDSLDNDVTSNKKAKTNTDDSNLPRINQNTFNFTFNFSNLKQASASNINCEANQQNIDSKFLFDIKLYYFGTDFSVKNLYIFVYKS